MPSPSPADLLARPTHSDAVGRLVAEVRGRLQAVSETPGQDRIERVEIGMEAGEVLSWLMAQRSASKVFWHGRGEAGAVAGVGVADLLEGDVAPVLAALEARLPLTRGTGVRYFGGLRFEPVEAPAPEWAAFGNARFLVPRVEYTVRGEEATLAVNLVLPRDLGRAETLTAELEALQTPGPIFGAPLPFPVDRADAPGRCAWQAGIERALEAFEAAELEKVVLARRARYTFEEPLDPFALLQALERATPSCFHFLFQPAPGAVFLGASPERLFCREGRALHSEAVAGTRPRGASEAADARFRDELRLSDKDQREHGYVREQIRHALAPFAETLDIDAEASDMQLARGRHLYSGIEAHLKPGVGTLDLLRALHPTPAVGGTPTTAAREMIRRIEPFDRGWYAGPVGWVGADAAEFAVAIRSGLVQTGPPAGEAPTLSLYSGAGIVRGSEPDAEWDEIEHKISDFARVLALDA